MPRKPLAKIGVVAIGAGAALLAARNVFFGLWGGARDDLLQSMGALLLFGGFASVIAHLALSVLRALSGRSPRGRGES